MLFGGFHPIIIQLKAYIGKTIASESGELYFYGVRKTIGEIAEINYIIFTKFAGGHISIFICALVGIVLMCLKFHSFLLAMPMFFLGCLAFFGGNRFIMYCTPVVAFGFAYFLYFILNYFTIRIWLKNAILATATCLALLPSVDFILAFRSPTMLTKDAITPLDELKTKASREDYIFSWWDYGYAIRYYADTKTLADPGSRQVGEYSYLASLALVQNQIVSANITRLNAQYIERSYNENFDLSLIQMQKDYNELEINNFIASLDSKNFALPQKSMQIYYYLVPHMINIFPNIIKLSSINVATGEILDPPLAHIGAIVATRLDGSGVEIGGGYVVPNAQPRFIIDNGEKKSINSYYHAGYNEDGKFEVNSEQIDENSDIFVIFSLDYDKILVLDKQAFNSAFIQLFVLENYDKELFEPISLSKDAKLYKLLK